MRTEKSLVSILFSFFLTASLLSLGYSVSADPVFQEASASSLPPPPQNILVKNRERFILFMLSNASIVNEEIADQRMDIMEAYRDFRNGVSLSTTTKIWLREIAMEYDVKDADFSKDKTWQILLNRVNIVPISLIIAQAINESAWGTSRFAVEGNNYFGQWCFSAGCGMIPKEKRSQGGFFEVQKFRDSLSSVWAYVNNLNTYYTYQKFRDSREALVKQGKPIAGLSLIHALSDYSEIRGAYVERITNVITKFDLSKYDKRSDVIDLEDDLVKKSHLNVAHDERADKSPLHKTS
jgi:Bax protein